MSLASTEAKPAPIAASDAGNRPSMDAVEPSSQPRRSPSSPSPPPPDRLSSSSPTTATFSERNDSETVESGSLSSEDGDGGWPRGANAMKLRDNAKRSLTGRTNWPPLRRARAVVPCLSLDLWHTGG